MQVFDSDGRYETQWNNLHRPCALCCCGGAKNLTFVIGELGPAMPAVIRTSRCLQKLERVAEIAR